MPEPFEFISKGLSLVAEKNFTEAEKYFQRGIQEYANQKDQDGVTFGLGRLGDCYEQAGLVDKARAVYEKAVQIGTDITKFSAMFTAHRTWSPPGDCAPSAGRFRLWLRLQKVPLRADLHTYSARSCCVDGGLR
jgi:tetratricopeptide (TPR) repeat protein